MGNIERNMSMSMNMNMNEGDIGMDFDNAFIGEEMWCIFMKTLLLYIILNIEID